MAQEFIVPSVMIDESDVGVRPTDQLSLAGIGLVGTFERGPVNVVTTIGDEEQLVKTFGSYVKGLTGYLSAVTALCQGANDLKIVRIAGKGAVKATASITKSEETLLTITAINEGVWGNEIKVDVAPNTDSSTFDLTVTFRTSIEKFRNLTLDTVKDINPTYVTIVKGKNGSGVPDKGSVTLSTGADGAEIQDSDYVGTIDSASGARTGLKALEPVQVGIVVCAQQHSETIQSAMISFCENCDIEEGLRVAVINSAPNLSADSAIGQTKTLDSARGIMAYPWVEFKDLPGEYIAPDGFYAGVLSTLNPHQSPSNKQVKGLLSTQIDFTYAQVKTLTLARISPITLVPNRGFRIRNGLNLSSDSAWSQINIRRQQDKMNMEIYNSLQWAISEPHAEPLWDNIAAQIDAYLQVQKNLGFIRNYAATLCNAQTNPPENVAARILTAQIRWLPLYAADFIIGKFQRLLSVEE